MPSFRIDPDIARASTLPAEVYRDRAWFDRQRQAVFAGSWQAVVGIDRADEPGAAVPWTLLPGCLDEPLLLVRDEHRVLRCLSNVCTHRGHLLLERPGALRGLRCRYHGRRFHLDGRLRSMPEFEGVEGFPAPSDDLPRLPLERFGPLAFTALDPAHPFEDWIAPVLRRVDWMRLDRFRFDAATSRDYSVPANWALYCDNYLEGFHIPYVHEALAEALDYGAYREETFPLGSLQIGIARDGDQAVFDLPASHPDRDLRVAGYYFWLFPSTMLNFYPWGLSLNVVEPQGPRQTRVRFLSYVWDAARRSGGAGADLHGVELEDEEVVASVQRGVASRLYRRGRYSPAREICVHHFHRLLARALREVPG